MQTEAEEEAEGVLIASRPHLAKFPLLPNKKKREKCFNHFKTLNKSECVHINAAPGNR